MNAAIAQNFDDGKWCIWFEVEYQEPYRRTVEGAPKIPLPMFWNGAEFVHDMSQALKFDSKGDALERVVRDSTVMQHWKETNEKTWREVYDRGWVDGI